MPVTQKEKIKRLKLVRDFFDLSQSEMAYIIGISQPKLSAIEKRGEGAHILNNIHYILKENLNVNPDWFVADADEMFIDNKPRIDLVKIAKQTKLKQPKLEINHSTESRKFDGEHHETKPSDNTNTELQQQIGVPMYNVAASAGNIEMYSDVNDAKPIGFIHVPGVQKNCFALPVWGHSMYPLLENGCWVILREVTNPQSIVWGEVYYIEWESYRMFKRLLKGDNESEVILWSENQLEKVHDRPKYAPIVIQKEEIRRLCLMTDIYKKSNH